MEKPAQEEAIPQSGSTRPRDGRLQPDILEKENFLMLFTSALQDVCYNGGRLTEKTAKKADESAWSRNRV